MQPVLLKASQDAKAGHETPFPPSRPFLENLENTGLCSPKAVEKMNHRMFGNGVLKSFCLLLIYFPNLHSAWVMEASANEKWVNNSPRYHGLHWLYADTSLPRHLLLDILINSSRKARRNCWCGHIIDAHGKDSCQYRSAQVARLGLSSAPLAEDGLAGHPCCGVATS